MARRSPSAADQPPAASRRGAAGALPVRVTAVVAALACSALAGCTPGTDARPAGTATPAGGGRGPAATGDGRGVTMTVAGLVSAVVGTHVFQLGREGAAPLLVFDPSPLERLRPGSPVEVTGTVQTFARRTLERGYHVVLDRSGTAPFEGEPVLVAATLSVGR